MPCHLDFITILSIAVAVSIDALVISISGGMMMKKFSVRHAFRIAFLFGFFQALMPLVGWLAGIGLAVYMMAFGHWVAFGLLFCIGIKMIWECFQKKTDTPAKDYFHGPTLLILSVATSIDALAVGISFALFDTQIFFPITIIGGVTFSLCFIGVVSGSRLSKFHGEKLDAVGGGMLILIGLKILLEHFIQGF